MVNSSTTNQTPSKQPIRLGIWGLQHSGKTVYMTMLYHYLSQGGSPWRIVTDDEKTEDFVNENLGLIMYSGQFCPSNEKRNKVKLYSYKLVNDKTEKIVELTFFDLAGEFFQTPSKEKIEVEGDTLLLVEHLNQCHGILFLISPLKEDSPNNSGGSYFTFLGSLFRSMQRFREGQKESKLEPYVVFCITKIDHSEVYKKELGRKAEDMLLRLLGPTIKLDWIANFFHAQIDSKNKTFLPDPSELNRCRVIPISCFGVDNDGLSPVSEDKIVTNIDLEEKTVSQFLDPVIEMNKSNSPSEYDVPSSDYDQAIQSKRKKRLKKYIIDLKKDFYPINMLLPIEWILKGIDKYHPKIHPLKSEE